MYRVLFIENHLILSCGLFWQPHVDFGLKVAGADLMSVPGLYQFVQVYFAAAILKCVFQ